MGNGQHDSQPSDRVHSQIDNGKPRARLVGLYTETPTHIGIGQSGGAIDLPVAREELTHFPLYPSSGLKGALRAYAKQHERSGLVDRLFGPEGKDAEYDAAGELLISDGTLLCLPVRSNGALFRWVTCPTVLQRLKRHILMINALAGNNPAAAMLPPIERVPFVPDENTVLTPTRETLSSVHLEDLTLKPESEDNVKELANYLYAFLPTGVVEQSEFEKRFAMVSDQAFEYLCRFSLPVRQRNKLEQLTKTVKEGQLWSEEYTPVDTLSYCLWVDRYGWDSLQTDSPSDTLYRSFEDKPYFQIGGKETIGCGWQQVSFPSLSRE